MADVEAGPTLGDDALIDAYGKPLVRHPFRRHAEGSRVAAEKHVQKWLDEDDAVDMLLSLIDGGWRPADEIAALLAQARADGEAAGRGDMEHFERLWRADERDRLARKIRADPGYYARLAAGEQS